LVGFVAQITVDDVCWLSSQCKRSVFAVVKTKSVVAKTRINENELKKDGKGGELAN
jgi:hypothetical protein